MDQMGVRERKTQLVLCWEMRMTEFRKFVRERGGVVPASETEPSLLKAIIGGLMSGLAYDKRTASVYAIAQLNQQRLVNVPVPMARLHPPPIPRKMPPTSGMSNFPPRGEGSWAWSWRDGGRGDPGAVSTFRDGSTRMHPGRPPNPPSSSPHHPRFFGLGKSRPAGEPFPTFVPDRGAWGTGVVRGGADNFPGQPRLSGDYPRETGRSGNENGDIADMSTNGTRGGNGDSGWDAHPSADHLLQQPQPRFMAGPDSSYFQGSEADDGTPTCDIMAIPGLGTATTRGIDNDSPGDMSNPAPNAMPTSTHTVRLGGADGTRQPQAATAMRAAVMANLAAAQATAETGGDGIPEATHATAATPTPTLASQFRRHESLDDAARLDTKGASDPSTVDAEKRLQQQQQYPEPPLERGQEKKIDPHDSRLSYWQAQSDFEQTVGAAIAPDDIGAADAGGGVSTRAFPPDSVAVSPRREFYEKAKASIDGCGPASNAAGGGGGSAPGGAPSGAAPPEPTSRLFQAVSAVMRSAGRQDIVDGNKYSGTLPNSIGTFTVNDCLETRTRATLSPVPSRPVVAAAAGKKAALPIVPTSETNAKNVITGAAIVPVTAKFHPSDAGVDILRPYMLATAKNFSVGSAKPSTCAVDSADDTDEFLGLPATGSPSANPTLTSHATAAARGNGEIMVHPITAAASTYDNAVITPEAAVGFSPGSNARGGNPSAAEPGAPASGAAASTTESNFLLVHDGASLTDAISALGKGGGSKEEVESGGEGAVDAAAGEATGGLRKKLQGAGPLAIRLDGRRVGHPLGIVSTVQARVTVRDSC